MKGWGGSSEWAVNDDCAHFLLDRQKGSMPSRKVMEKERGRRQEKKQKGGGEKEQKQGRRVRDVGTVDERYVRNM